MKVALSYVLHVPGAHFAKLVMSCVGGVGIKTGTIAVNTISIERSLEFNCISQ